MKCRNGLVGGNLFSRQLKAFATSQPVSSQSLSTSKLSANQYDDLYADRWAKFQCELATRFDIFRGQHWFSSLSRVTRNVNLCALAPLRSLLSCWCLVCHDSRSWRAERIPYNLYTKQHLFGNYSSFYAAKKLPKNVNIKGVFAANELDLDEVNVYGFDYDYT